MADTLNVYFKNKLAGYLTYDNGLLSFQYDKDYIASNECAPLSVSLPLNDTIFNDSFVPTKDNTPKKLVIYVNSNKPEQISVYRDSIIAPLSMFIVPIVFIVILLLDIKKIKKEKNKEK